MNRRKELRLEFEMRLVTGVRPHWPRPLDLTHTDLRIHTIGGWYSTASGQGAMRQGTFHC